MLIQAGEVLEHLWVSGSERAEGVKKGGHRRSSQHRVFTTHLPNATYHASCRHFEACSQPWNAWGW